LQGRDPDPAPASRGADHLASLLVQVLPDWLLQLPDAETMRAVDRWAIEQRGIPPLELMERAGGGVARVVEELAPDGAVVVVCGKGNNGGDGLVVARLLRDAGREVTVVFVAPPEDLSPDARANFDRLAGAAHLRLLPGEGADRESEVAGALERAAVIVDGLLGTGFEGEPRGLFQEAIDVVNASRAPTVSVDVPSGVNASTGVVLGRAVQAAVTVTFHAGKPGLWITPGKTHAGVLKTIDIGGRPWSRCSG